MTVKSSGGKQVQDSPVNHHQHVAAREYARREK